MEKKDRISDLPDSIIHHILSFLPSTKQAIRTSILSKRWRKQWTNLPVLIFDLPGKLSDFSDEHISLICTSMDNTLILHNCSKVKKFHIQSTWYNFTLDPNYIEKLRFPIRKQAEHLDLDFSLYADPKNNKLPNFFFSNASLIKLHLNGCSLIPNGRVNWDRLKDLYIGCSRFSNEEIEGVLSGSPLLESLNIHYCEGFDTLLVIASKSLKKLGLEDIPQRFFLEVSCPNLVEFNVMTKGLVGGHLNSLPDGAIQENFNLCGNPLHELLELKISDGFMHLVIDSNSLKKLHLLNTGFTDEVLISCQNLEEFYFSSLLMENFKFVNHVPSSVYATIGYCCDYVFNDDLVRTILGQLRHVNELNIPCCFIKVLSEWEMRGVSSPTINSKCLTLDCGYKFVQNLPGIANALRTSPELEKLVINFGWLPCRCGNPVSKKKYVWNSKGAVFKCLVSHLKIVEVSGLSRKHEKELELALNFIEYVLKNARVLEKMVITLKKRKADFVFEVSQKLSSFSKFSQHAIVELC